jgi:Peptidase propeptide and YPEB domain
MTGWPLHKIHKWIAVTAGVFLLMWLFSGISMVLPPISPGPDPVRRPPNVDFREITLSPAQAVANLEKALGTSSRVNSVNLKRIQDIVAYEVRVENGAAHLINAVSGKVFSITRDLAERYVRDAYPTEGGVVKVEKIDRYSYAYQWGSLPVYRVVLDANPSVDFYVSVNDGVVRRIDRWYRLRGLLGSLHTFQPLKLITSRDELRRGLLVLLSLVAIGAAATGYYLALARRA